MGIIEALLLGAIQGITEFLPVSSSGHLVLMQKILGISEPALLFDTMVHGGTLIGVFVVLRRDIWGILRRPIQPLTGLLILATIPTVIIALIFKDRIEAAFQSGALLGFAFLFTAAALLTAEYLFGRPRARRPKEAMRWTDSLVIGICQGIAIIPGVSRSGLTLAGALSKRLDRNFAARFSFLLSIPVILGALVLQAKDLLDAGKGPVPGVEDVSSGIGPAALMAGTLSAAVVGYFSVRIMLKIVRERSLRGFAIYVAILGILVLTDQYITHFFF
ncbi:MAG: undecaprenyl-diphosphate phosphatase [Spirochaetaceae bacterium]|jgi:undecaprenyl-diphosphatase|nr:undecaprenyl-diphosphate phosphatase [Spirochaetaceae bacterium]